LAEGIPKTQPNLFSFEAKMERLNRLLEASKEMEDYEAGWGETGSSIPQIRKRQTERAKQSYEKALHLLRMLIEDGWAVGDPQILFAVVRRIHEIVPEQQEFDSPYLLVEERKLLRKAEKVLLEMFWERICLSE